MIADVLFTLGSVIMAFSPSVGVLMLGRLVLGFGIGAASQIVPLYLSEVAPVEIRGKLVAFNIVVVGFAQMLSALICYLLRPHWRWMLGAIGLVSTIQLIGMFFMPETPRWLGKSGHQEKQLAVMRQIYRPEHLDKAFEDLNKEVESLKEETKLSEWTRIKTLCSCYGRCLLIGCGILAFQ